MTEATQVTRRTALASLAAPAVLRGARRAGGDKPNLLFVWTDQQRFDTLAAYGNPRYRVPNMNRLAAESVVFERSYVTQPVCTPSRSSVLSGLYPHQNGCVRNNIALGKESKTLPEILNDSAYRTGYFGKWHLGDEIFAQRGFQEWAAIEDGIYREYYSPGLDKNDRSAYHKFLAGLGYKPDQKQQNDFTRGFATKLPVEHSKPSFLAQEASKFILKHRNDPWLLYVNFLEPHTPFSSALNELHTEQECPLPKNFPGIPQGGEPEWYGKRRAQFQGPRGAEGFVLNSPAAWRGLQRNYAGLCSLVDQAVGRILWALEASGARENTIVVYTSDHGEMMGSHQLLTKQVMYEEACRVPYLLRVPFRKQQPLRVKAPVSHIDFVPTLLDLLGKRDVSGLAGESAVAMLEGKARRDNDVFLQWTKEGGGQGPDARGVITPEGQKLVLHDTDKSMLFDHARDPYELNNVYGAPAAAAMRKRLRGKIEAWQKRFNDKMALPA